jgi:predicted Zn finger-like uncharacterized protein
MSLITRCPACGTMFKVVADQLKVAQGWVRCGHCAEVFDASAHLLPDDAGGLAPSALMPDDEPVLQEVPWLQNAEEPAAPEELAQAQEPAISPEVPASDMAADFDPAGWKQARQERHEVETMDLDALPSRPELVHTASADDANAKPSDLTDSVAVDDKAVDAEAVHEVSFVRDARRKAFWKKPLARRSLGAVSLLLLLALTLQWVIQEKDTLAAREPRLVPLLQRLCGTLRCEIRPARHIDALVIDSSTFTAIGTGAYRLSFALKNTAATPLEIPSLEVTLTDTQDQALVRRVLAPAQYGASTATLAAHSELVGSVSMKVSGDSGRAISPSLPSSASAAPPATFRVAGYRILAFYP